MDELDLTHLGGGLFGLMWLHLALGCYCNFLAFDFVDELDPFRPNPSGGRSLRIDMAPPKPGL